MTGMVLLESLFFMMLVLITKADDDQEAQCPNVSEKYHVTVFEKSPTILGHATLCNFDGIKDNSESVEVKLGEGCSPLTDTHFQDYMRHFSHCDNLVHCVCGKHAKCLPIQEMKGKIVTLMFQCMETHANEGEKSGSMLMALGSELP